jgi:phosphoserine phosphatase RsbU/P
LAELTARVNALMCMNTGGNKFVTFFWGTLDLPTRTLTYVNAGHNPPFLLRKSGVFERLDRGGMILGVLDAPPPYEQASITLSADDVLVLFTDGVSEAMNAEAVEYGEARLEEVVRRVASHGAQEVVDAIQQDVIQHAAGAPQSDDITLMVLRMTPRGRAG